jgi:hypothetical protein
MTIYGVGTTVDGKTVAVKEAQIYGDLVGNTTVRGSVVTVSANGGYYNSTVARENYQGIAEVGRAVVQPIIWGIVSAGTLNQAGGAASTAADAVKR